MNSSHRRALGLALRNRKSVFCIKGGGRQPCIDPYQLKWVAPRWRKEIATNETGAGKWKPVYPARPARASRAAQR